MTNFETIIMILTAVGIVRTFGHIAVETIKLFIDLHNIKKETNK